MTVMIWANSDGIIGRCDAKCHHATTPKCECMCGGRYHGAGGGVELERRLQEFGGQVLEAAKEQCREKGWILAVPSPRGRGFVPVFGDLPLLEATIEG